MTARFLITAVAFLYAATIPMNAHFQRHFVSGKSRDIVQNIFGGLRGMVADWSYMKAEEYHHRGLPFLKSTAYHQGESALMEESVDRSGKSHHAHGEEPVAPSDFFSKVYDAVKVTGDSHLTPAEEKEVLPWFYVEVRFNPHDIRGYILGAYWLKRMGKNAESLNFLKEGLKNNPESAQIFSALGDYYYQDKDSDRAIIYLERAKTLWSKDTYPNKVTDEYMKTDRFYAYDLLGDLYEKRREYRKAAQVYGELFSADPNRILLQKIMRLKGIIEGK